MRPAVIVMLVLLAGCQKSFDDRYADAEKKVREQAASIDKELSARESEAALARDVGASEPALPGALASGP
jgi:hypothetical protein